MKPFFFFFSPNIAFFPLHLGCEQDLMMVELETGNAFRLLPADIHTWKESGAPEGKGIMVSSTAPSAPIIYKKIPF